MEQASHQPDVGTFTAEQAEGLQENPAVVLKLMHEGLTQVRTETAAHLQITPPRALIPAASHLFGREEDLTKLLELLKTQTRLAITGPGGVGKTALCAGLVRRVEAEPWGRELTSGGLFMHDFNKEPALAAFVSGILEQAGLVRKSSARQPAMAALVLRQPGVMLYLEGLQNLLVVDALLEFTGSATRVLLTTRDPFQAEGMQVYPLKALDFADAAAAIHYYASRHPRPKRAGPWPYGPETPGWDPLARDLGGNPLSCRLAGALCASQKLDPAALHQRLGLQGSGRSLHVLFRQCAVAAQAMPPRGWRRLVEWLTHLFSRLKGSSRRPGAALTAWHCLSLGGTRPVPLSVLQAFGVANRKDLDPLLQLGLAQSTRAAAEQDGADEPAYALTHTLPAEWARNGLAEFGRPAELLLKPAMRWGEALFDRLVLQKRVPGGEARYLAVVPVAEALMKEVGRQPDLPPGVFRTFFYLPGRMHELHTRQLAAEAVYRRVLVKMEEAGGEEDHATADIFNSLGVLLQAMNRLAEAEPLYRRALAIDEAPFSKNHPDLPLHLNNLASLLKDANRLAEAEPLYRRALAFDEETLGGDHPTVATRLNNLASLLADTNQLAEAEPLMRRALAIDEASFGKDHPQVALRLNNLATLLRDTNRLAEAEPLMRRALALDEATLGKNHPDVAGDLSNLAQLLKATNRLAEAEPLMRRALAIDEASFGKDHPNVAKDLNNLAMLFRDTNRLADAGPLMRRALAVNEAHFGPGHPAVATGLNNLAALLSHTDHPEEVESLHRRALAIDEASFGKDHPNVAKDLNNLATLLADTNRLAEAEPLMRRALQIRGAFTAATGHPHPELMNIANNYASLLMQAGDTEEQAVVKIRAILAPMRDKLPWLGET
jgi:tetratricopeptide (TPR) repeat protein